MIFFYNNSMKHKQKKIMEKNSKSAKFKYWIIKLKQKSIKNWRTKNYLHCY